MNIAEATVAGRFHHQWLPDKLSVEKGINLDTIEILKSKGHNIIKTRAIGSTQSIMKLDNYLYGASDTRRADALTLGYNY